MTTDRRRAEQAASLLEGVLSGSIEPAQALESWPYLDDETDEALKSAWHELSHYVADQDIRGREPEYEQFIKETLAAFVKEIRQNSRF
jgi:hypothetical protein